MTLTVLALGLGAAACVSGQPPRDEVAYGCGDVVMVGRARTLNYQDMSPPGDVLGHGQFDLRIEVERIIVGRERRRRIHAAWFAHNGPRSDADFVFVLTPDENAYRVQNAHLLGSWPDPQIADTCTPSAPPSD